MNKMNVYQYGNTIVFECTFFDEEGNAVEPESVQFIVYNSKYKVILNSIPEKVDGVLGKYVYRYTTENKEQKLYYEFLGIINGLPSLKRNSFMTKFL